MSNGSRKWPTRNMKLAQRFKRNGTWLRELPNQITDPVTKEQVQQFYNIAIPPESFARTVAFAIEQPEDVDINEILFRPTAQVV
jgi:NADP-dependent 3-hydroxy acid dehydrogenase YdfG